jgi:hypothetical protein
MGSLRAPEEEGGAGSAGAVGLGGTGTGTGRVCWSEVMARTDRGSEARCDENETGRGWVDGLGRARRGGRDGVAAACGLGEVGGAGMVETARDRGGAALADGSGRGGLVGSAGIRGFCQSYWLVPTAVSPWVCVVQTRLGWRSFRFDI